MKQFYGSKSQFIQLESRVIYTPIISNSKEPSQDNVPFYYPKVIKRFIKYFIIL